MTYRSKPIIYVRVARGGREAAQMQEQQVRLALEGAGISTEGMHVYCDLDTSGSGVGQALSLLLEEASYRRVGTVIVLNLARFGCYEVLLHALMTLERGGARVVTVNEVVEDPAIAGALLAHGEASTGRAAGVVVGGLPHDCRCPNCGRNCQGEAHRAPHASEVVLQQRGPHRPRSRSRGRLERLKARVGMLVGRHARVRRGRTING